MAVSYAELKAKLDVDEPDYAALAVIAAGAMQHLRKLAASDDVSVASKAVSLAGIIGDTGSVAVITDAARSREAIVRVAAAHAASLLPASAQAARIVTRLLDDRDIGIVKIAARAASRQSDAATAAKGRQASARLVKAVRAAVKANAQRERDSVMAMKALKKTPSKGARGKAPTRASAPEQMPGGAMAAPPTGIKSRAMPTGKMK